MALSDAKIKDLLEDAADSIRRLAEREKRDGDNDACEVLLNVAAVVEHMEPKHLRSEKRA